MLKQFGDRLKELRLEKELTQEELAKIFNTGKASISHYESNRRVPDISVIKRFADFFGVSVDYIMGYIGIRGPIDLETFSNAYMGYILSNPDKFPGGIEDDATFLMKDTELLKEKFGTVGNYMHKLRLYTNLLDSLSNMIDSNLKADGIDPNTIDQDTKNQMIRSIIDEAKTNIVRNKDKQ